jgi:nicotinate phosphoribosyltransferase
MESILEISGNILECQLLETLIINEIHSNTSLATKSSRIVQSSGNSTVIDFSARRTYGYNAALKASKNAYISGFEGTSNVDAGKMFGIPLIGTMGHSYVLSFRNEYQSFLNYAKEFKNNSTFLIDTYDSLKGIKNAIDVHKNEGKDVHSIRLDSGDIKELSFKARQMLDAAGLKSTKIIATGSMDEYKINELINNQKCPIDIFGVGSNFGVSSDTPVLECVYKLVEIENNPVNKLSPNKSYFPYSKQVHRKIDDNLMNHDVVTRSNMVKDGYSSMIKNIYEKGEYIEGTDSINKVRNYVKSQLEQLPEENKNIEIQQEYSVIFEI